MIPFLCFKTQLCFFFIKLRVGNLSPSCPLLLESGTRSNCCYVWFSSKTSLFSDGSHIDSSVCYLVEQYHWLTFLFSEYLTMLFYIHVWNVNPETGCREERGYLDHTLNKRHFEGCSPLTPLKTKDNSLVPDVFIVLFEKLLWSLCSLFLN